MSSTSIAEINAYVNLVSPSSSGERLELSSTPQPISKTSMALFKTSKRYQHDKVLGQLLIALSYLLEQAKTLKFNHEKLESSSLFLQHELMAQKQALRARHALETANSDDEDTFRFVSDDVLSYQLAIRLQRRRFGIFKHYKQAKHSQIILVCAEQIRKLIAIMQANLNANDQCIHTINETRSALQALQ